MVLFQPQWGKIYKTGKSCFWLLWAFYGRLSSNIRTILPSSVYGHTFSHLSRSNPRFLRMCVSSLQTCLLNKHLSSLLPGLTAKVFRTFNASITLQEQLQQLSNSMSPKHHTYIYMPSLQVHLFIYLFFIAFVYQTCPSTCSNVCECNGCV